MIEATRKLLSKRAVKNGMWLYILQVFNTISPLLTLPYITRVLGASDYGVFSIALNIIGYFQVVVEYGFGMSGSRKVALLEDKSKLEKVFTSIVSARTLLCAGCFTLTYIYVMLFGKTTEQNLCTLILFLSVLGLVLQQTWIFQGLQQMKYITIISVISRLISLACIFLFVKSKEDLYLYCIFYSISPIVSGVIGTLFVIFKFNIHFIKICFSDIWEEIQDGWYVFTTSMSSKIFSAIGITFLGIFSSDATVGIYSAIQKIPIIMMLAWTPLNQVIYPISSKKMTDSYEIGKIFVYGLRKKLLPIFLLFGGGVAIVSKWIVLLLFGSEYAQYFYWIYPLLLWLVIGINNNFLGIQILLGGGYSKEYSTCFQIGVICTILFNVIFIYFWGGMGAALAPAASEIVLGILLKLKISKLDLINKVKS